MKALDVQTQERTAPVNKAGWQAVLFLICMIFPIRQLYYAAYNFAS